MTGPNKVSVVVSADHLSDQEFDEFLIAIGRCGEIRRVLKLTKSVALDIEQSALEVIVGRDAGITVEFDHPGELE